MSSFSTKIASTVSVVALVATAMSTSLVSAASEFLPYAELLVDNGVINSQTTEAGYRLNDTITRAELAKVVANLGQYTPTSCVGTVFGDVKASLGDLCGYVEALAEAGVVTTANSNFRPLDKVTRAEMTKMILGALDEAPSATDAGYLDVTASLGDLVGFINRARELGCVNAASYFRPNASSSRGETFKIAACIAQKAGQGTGTGTSNTGTSNTGTVAGALTVALDGAAVAQYVPKNASSVKVGSVKLTAGAKDVVVRSMTVGRSGLGAATDVLANQGVRAAQGGVIVSSSSDYYNSTSQKGNIYFFPALVVKAGSSTSLDILVSLSGAENSQHQFTLESVNSDATVSGTPVTLGLLNTTSYVTSSVSVAGSYNYSVTPGKTQQTIAKVDLTAGNRDVVINGFALTRSGGTDLTRRFANVSAYKNGVKVGTATVSADKITVTGLANALPAGNFQAFELRADALVDGSSNNNMVQFKVESTSDVSATEVSTGYATQTSGITNNGLVVSTVTFTNVDVTYVKTSSGNQTVAPGTSNVTLFAGKLSSTVPLTVKQLTITPGVGALSGALAFANDQLSVRLNGSEIATIGASEFPAGSTAPITKVVSLPVDATTPATITIVGSSIKNTTAMNSAYQFTVALSDVRDTANNTVSLVSSALVGDKTTIQAPTLTLKNATVAAPTNSTIASVSNQEVGRFALSADGDAVRVTKVVASATGTLTTLSDIVSASSIQLWNVDKNTQVSASVSISGNNVTFDSLAEDILKDATNNYKIVFSTVNSLDSNYGKTLQFAVATTGLTVTTINSSSTVALAGTAAMKQYTIGIVPPTVVVTAKSPLDRNMPIATIRVTNTDSNTGVTLSNMVLEFAARSTANGNFTFSGNICLRDLGSSNACGTAGTTTAQVVTQAGGSFTIAIAGSALSNASNTLAKNGGYSDFEVFVDNAPLWVAGDNANTTVKSINYSVIGGPSSTQSYVGVASASATATK